MRINICLSFFLLVVFLGFASCNVSGEDNNEERLVKIGDRTLTLSEMRTHLPSGLSADDSIRFARAYINDWINTELIDGIASEDLPDMDRINSMVSEYRRQLIANEYKRLRQGELLSQTVNEDSLRAYYESRKSDFILSQPLLKGIYIKADSTDRNIPEILKLLSSQKSDAIDKLEQQHSDKLIHYEYFRDRWTPWNRIDAVFPFPAGFNIKENLNRQRPYMITSNGFTYILAVSDFLSEGEIAPFEMVENDVARAIVQDNTEDLYGKIISDLYQEGLKKEKIEVFCDLNR